MHDASLVQTPSEHWRQRPGFASDDFANFRRNGMSAGLDGMASVVATPEDFEDFEKVNGPHIAYNFAEFQNQWCPRWFVERVLRVGTGNPPTIEVTGLPITASDLSCLMNAWRLWGWLEQPPRVVVEIGGGFGCLAAMLLRMWPQIEYHGVDLDQSLALQDYYLGQQHPGGRWTLHRDVPDGVVPDLVINIRSMMEMNLAQVGHYLHWIQQFDDGLRFYCVNAYKKRTALPDYPLDLHWHAELVTKVMDQAHIAELILRRQHEGGFQIIRNGRE